MYLLHGKIKHNTKIKTVKIMIAKIDKEGVLSITPETKEEDKTLADWYFKHGKEIARKVILFERVEK